MSARAQCLIGYGQLATAWHARDARSDEICHNLQTADGINEIAIQVAWFFFLMAFDFQKSPF